MNALVKKEIRLLLPSWIVAMLLALVQAIARPYDFYVASLLFFGLTIMALTTFGRETSLNTFSLLLAQPAERMRIWQTKISVLAVAFLTVFVLWLVCFFISTFQGFATNDYDDYNLFITICLIATATFTGGLWTTLLLRQVAGAFWLTLLVPAVLSGFSAVFLAQSQSNSTVIAVLCVVFAIYSVGGFLFARWLFFRAQDVGWSGGVISLPEWKFFAARSKSAVSTRNRKPIFALFKKEFQLQQVSLMGAAGLLVLHISVIVLRKYHPFAKDSASEVLTAIFWMLWLVLPVVIGAMAVAEERRLGVMEGQLCLPVSRRIQFAIKGFFTLSLAIFLGGVMPMLLENIAVGFGAHNPMFTPEGGLGVLLFQSSIVAFAGWLALVSFFASTLARSFLQAVGLGIATFIGCMLLIPVFTNNRMIFFDSLSVHSFLPIVIGVPTIIVTLLWLAYLNFKNFRDGWPLWRRNLLGFTGTFVFIVLTTTAIYNRAWEIFEPAEPPHGPAIFSLANPPKLNSEYGDLLVQLPDGRVWFNNLSRDFFGNQPSRWKELWLELVPPLPKSAGAQQFVAGSNWVSAMAKHIVFYQHYEEAGNKPENHVVGYLDMVGVQADGTLWISDGKTNGIWIGDKMNRFGDGTNWQQVVRSYAGVLLLKNDGTLWRRGTNNFGWNNWQTNWPSLRTYPLHQIGTDSDWKEIRGYWNTLVQKSDGSVWSANVKDEHWQDKFHRETNLDQVSFQTLSSTGNGDMAYVRPDGTLWMSGDYQQNGTNVYSGFVRVGTETNWTAVALTWNKMVALKSDGSLWQWAFNRTWNFINQENLFRLIQKPPMRVGIHNDWVAIADTWGDVTALTADGSLWLWPDREQYEQYTLLKLPKQPQFLGNVFGKAD
jgi:ABC-type transport system involved in multi-copper enzyme maturation permease subunit